MKLLKKLSPRIFKNCDSGVVAIESAILLPILILLYFGMIDLTHLMSEQRKITNISGTIADLIGQHSRYVSYTKTGAVIGGDLGDYFRVAPMVMKPDTDAKVRIRVAGYGLVSGTFKLKWSVNNDKGSACATQPSMAQIQALSTNGRDVILTQVCSDVKLFYGHILKPFFGGAGPRSDFDVEYSVMIAPRISTIMECYNSTSTNTGASTCPTTG